MTLCEASKCSDHLILIIVGTLFNNYDHIDIANLVPRPLADCRASR